MQLQPRFTIIFLRNIVAPEKCLGHGFMADARTTIYRNGEIVWTIVSCGSRGILLNLKI